MAYRTYLMVCAGTGCVANQSLKIKDKLELATATELIQHATDWLLRESTRPR